MHLCGKMQGLVKLSVLSALLQKAKLHIIKELIQISLLAFFMHPGLHKSPLNSYFFSVSVN